MDIDGEERIAAPRHAVWAALNDPDVLRPCIPGCERLEQVSPTEFVATVKVKFSLISMTFTGTITLSDVDPPESYTISAAGQGGVAGFAKGSAKVMLVPDGNETLLRYSAGAEIGGTLAQIGSRLIGSTTQKLAARFFAEFTRAAQARAAEANA